eukprot:8560374-Pyramimonas_sp.AAC.1
MASQGITIAMFIPIVAGATSGAFQTPISLQSSAQRPGRPFVAAREQQAVDASPTTPKTRRSHQEMLLSGREGRSMPY